MLSGKDSGTLASAPNRSFARIGLQYRPRTKKVALHFLSFFCASLLALLQTPIMSHAEDGAFEQGHIQNLENYVFYNDHSNELRKFETSQLTFNFISVDAHTLEEMVETNLHDLHGLRFGEISTNVLPKGGQQHAMGTGVLTIVFGSKRGIQNHDLLKLLKSIGDGFEIYETGTAVSKSNYPQLYTKRKYVNNICTSFSTLNRINGDRVSSIIFIENTINSSRCLMMQFMWLIGFANISNTIGTGGTTSTQNFANEIDILMDDTLTSGMDYGSFRDWNRLQKQ